MSCLQIAAICQEAGMHAVRKNRYVILPKDFEKGYRTNVKKPDTDFEFYKWRMLGAHKIIQLLLFVVYDVQSRYNARTCCNFPMVIFMVKVGLWEGSSGSFKKRKKPNAADVGSISIFLLFWNLPGLDVWYTWNDILLFKLLCVLEGVVWFLKLTMERKIPMLCLLSFLCIWEFLGLLLTSQWLVESHKLQPSTVKLPIASDNMHVIISLIH